MSIRSKLSNGLNFLACYIIVTTLCTAILFCVVTGFGYTTIKEKGIKRAVQIVWYGPAYDKAFPQTFTNTVYYNYDGTPVRD